MKRAVDKLVISMQFINSFSSPLWLACVYQFWSCQSLQLEIRKFLVISSYWRQWYPPFKIPSIIFWVSSILNVVPETASYAQHLFSFQNPQVLVVYSAIQNKDHVSQPPLYLEARWLVLADRSEQKRLVTSRIFWKKLVCALYPHVLVYFYPSARNTDSYGNQSSSHHIESWTQGPYSKAVGTVSQKASGSVRTLWTGANTHGTVLLASALSHTREMHFYFVSIIIWGFCFSQLSLTLTDDICVYIKSYINNWSVSDVTIYWTWIFHERRDQRKSKLQGSNAFSTLFLLYYFLLKKLSWWQ